MGSSTHGKAPYPPTANASSNPVPTAPQAMSTSYVSRLRTGSSLLMQPIISVAPANSVNAMGPTKRRGGVVNYAEGASEDEFGVDSDDDEDFVTGSGTRSGRRGTPRASGTAGSSRTGSPSSLYAQPSNAKVELDKTYLGLVPPSKYITWRSSAKTRHEYPSLDQLQKAAKTREVLVPIRIDLDTETHRIRDCFVWNLNEEILTPEVFARIFCQDLDLPVVPYVDQVAGAIKTQLEEHAGVASFDVDAPSRATTPPPPTQNPSTEANKVDCRVILALDVQISTFHLLDHIEWDLAPATTSSSAPQITPESFAQILCADMGLGGEAPALVAHAIHEEILKHKKDAIEWGVLAEGLGRHTVRSRGPRPLRGVWRDWNDTGEFGPRLEVMSAEEMERREIERERIARRLRRDTSRFVKATARRRR
ncbi:hypothetical protein BS47DRAFT_1372665 [Hydnum rufescens UP504]|uniref:SNF5-domain-containing protein n=1 Tax=Hydnum rufescens UP504 TaxID=1448309 RepID=A0A9P6AVW1_9AGAM|nr:hypothetical protein BS47DRAFT_1372665 [Hydnum rufescens UP504]